MDYGHCIRTCRGPSSSFPTVDVSADDPRPQCTSLSDDFDTQPGMSARGTRPITSRRADGVHRSASWGRTRTNQDQDYNQNHNWHEKGWACLHCASVCCCAAAKRQDRWRWQWWWQQRKRKARACYSPCWCRMCGGSRVERLVRSPLCISLG